MPRPGRFAILSRRNADELKFDNALEDALVSVNKSITRTCEKLDMLHLELAHRQMHLVDGVEVQSATPM